MDTLRDTIAQKQEAIEALNIRIVGIGGQGVIASGIILAKALIKEGFNVAQTQSYGAEVSGTPNSADIVCSRREILYPYVEEADVIISLHKLGFEKYGQALKPNGILIYESELSRIEEPPKNIVVYSIPAAELSEDIGGDRRGLNLVMLGAISRVLGFPTLDSLASSIPSTIRREGEFKKYLVAGYEYFEKNLLSS